VAFACGEEDRRHLMSAVGETGRPSLPGARPAALGHSGR